MRVLETVAPRARDSYYEQVLEYQHLSTKGFHSLVKAKTRWTYFGASTFNMDDEQLNMLLVGG